MRTFKRLPTLFLQAVIILIGIGVLAFMILEPLHEGRNVNATLVQVYFNDPFLAYVYIASVAFFMALYQAWKLLGFIANNKAFSSDAVRAVRTVKYSAITLAGFIVPPLAYLLIARHGDDIAGGVAMGLFVLLISAIAAAAATVFERLLHSAVDTH